jgi:RimJ/RimL family protein N-acetyltransferase
MNRIREEIHFMIIILRVVGLKFFLKRLRLQIYSKSTEIGFTLDLTNYKIPHIEASIKYSLQTASKEDMGELLQGAKTESKESAYHLTMQLWMYEDGYHNYYIARTTDTNEICFIQSIIYPDDIRMARGRFKNVFPKLKIGEAIIESSYTFERFRGNRLHPAITTDLLRSCKERGLKRMIAHVSKDNIASIKGTERAGYTQFEEVSKVKFLSYFRWEKQVNLSSLKKD